jgi:hypothetical protein
MPPAYRRFGLQTVISMMFWISPVVQMSSILFYINPLAIR